MTSKIKVDNINKVSDDSTIIKKCGSTTTVGSGAGNTIVVCGATVTLGRCGGTVALASGASQTGFGRTGTVNWQTTVKTGDFTGVSGEGYFVNTTSGTVTMTLPGSPSAGDIVSVKDYAFTFNSNNFIINRNSSPIGGGSDFNTLNYSTNGAFLTFIYVDGTKGWLVTDDSSNTSSATSALIEATGGCVATVDTNFKVHTFTGPGTFCVTAGGGALGVADYLVIAGGGSGGRCGGGGGGAGGFRESHIDATSGPYTASPLAVATSLSFTQGAYAVVVGAGGNVAPQSCTAPRTGSNSSISTITSTGGGYGGNAFGNAGGPGGSGGGGGGAYPCTPAGSAGGNGNDPPTTPSQGNNGGTGSTSPTSSRPQETGGGGGAGAVGANAVNSTSSANGGDGVTTNITGSPVARAGGGGGGTWSPNGWGAGSPVGSGGAGGGGSGGRKTGPGGAQEPALNGTDGTVNTGSGGGGAGRPYAAAGGTNGAGGSGLVVIRYKFQ